MNNQKLYLPDQIKSSHFKNLDSIRGIAIIMVVIFHSFQYPANSQYGKIANDFLQSLSLGVPLFFVLSGFVISNSIFRTTDKFDWRRYSTRRLARIFPPFILSLSLCGILAYKSKSYTTIWVDIASNLATLPNILMVKTLNPVSWSLFVEMHFYLILPLVFIISRSINKNSYAKITILLFFVVSSVTRFISWYIPADNLEERFFLLNRTPNTLDYFAWGLIFTMLLMSDSHWTKGRRAIFLAGMGLAGIPVVSLLFVFCLQRFNVTTHIENQFVHEISRLAISMVGFLMLFSSNIPTNCGLSKIYGSRLLTYIGVISYEWFLFHLAVIPRVRYHFMKYLDRFHLANFKTSIDQSDSNFILYLLTTIIGIAVSFVIAALIHRYFSTPIMNLVRRSKYCKLL